MVVLVVWGKNHCVSVVVIDLLWDYSIVDKSNLLNVFLDSTCKFN